jgi:hypothetical protein
MRKNTAHVLSVALCVLVSGTCLSYEPVFKSGVRITADGANIDVGFYSVPEAYDWNSDGKKDLLVGQFEDGKVRLYLNSGTDAAPVLTTFSFIQSAGEDLTVPPY